MSDREQRLAALGYDLDDIPGPGAIYKPVIVHERTVYVSGAVPISKGVVQYAGKVPSDFSVEEAKASAALCAANNLRVVRQELGSLDKVERVLRVTGYVNSDLDFSDQHLVINGASELLLEVFGDEGLCARSALGMAQLPLNAATEVEMILALKPES